MKIQKTCFLALAAALSLCGAGATDLRAQVPPAYEGQAHWFPLQEEGALARSYGPGVGFKFNPGADPDYVALARQGQGVPQVMLWVDVMIHDALVPLDIHANDLDVQRDYQVGGPQALLTVGPSGLERHAYDAAGDLQTTLIEPGWAGAIQVVTGHFFGGTQRLDVAGLASDGRDVMFLEQTASSFQAVPGFTLPAVAGQMEVLDIDDDGGLDELAFRFGPGVQVYEPTGTRHYTVVPGGTSVAMSPVHDTSYDAHHLAVLTQSAFGSQTLHVIGPDGTVLQSTGLGSLRAVTCTATETDSSNTLQELALSLVTEQYPALLVLPSASSAPTVTPLHLPPMDPDSGDPFNEATLVSHDFDHDGDDDLVFPSKALDDLYVFRGTGSDETRISPGEGATGPDFSGSLDLAARRLTLSWALPDPEDVAGMTRVEVAVWTKQGPAADAADLRALPIHAPEPFAVFTDDYTQQASHAVMLELGDRLQDLLDGEFFLYARARLTRTANGGTVTVLTGPSSVLIAGKFSVVDTLAAGTPWGTPGGAQAFIDEATGMEHVGAGASPERTVLPHPQGFPPTPQ